ncbi:unnamed protein product [Urochloa humidicola]
MVCGKNIPRSYCTQIDTSGSQPQERNEVIRSYILQLPCSLAVAAILSYRNPRGNPRMDADAELLEALVIMVTVILFGILVIMGVFRTGRFISAILFIVFAAFCAWGLIRVKRLYFWLQRTGRFDQKFSLMQLHLSETVSFLMLLRKILQFSIRPVVLNLQGVRIAMKRFFGNHPARSRALLLFLIGLAITGYGIGLFLADISQGDFGVYLIAAGLTAVTAGASADGDSVTQMAGLGFPLLFTFRCSLSAAVRQVVGEAMWHDVTNLWVQVQKSSLIPYVTI